MEEYVGEPYCYTIDVYDEKALRAVLEKIKNNKVQNSKVFARGCPEKLGKHLR